MFSNLLGSLTQFQIFIFFYYSPPEFNLFWNFGFWYLRKVKNFQISIYMRFGGIANSAWGGGFWGPAPGARVNLFDSDPKPFHQSDTEHLFGIVSSHIC